MIDTRIAIRRLLVAAGYSIFLVAMQPSANATFCGTPTPPCNPSDPSTTCYRPPRPDPKCTPPDPDARCEPKSNKCRRSPCYVGSGVYTASDTDLRLPTAGFPLLASRTYESTDVIDGPLGYGWTSSLTSHLYYTAYLFAAPATYQKEADITMPDGNRLRFVDNGDGTFTAPAGRYDTLTHNPDDSFDLKLEGTMSVFHFASDGVLTSVTDDYGNLLAFTYDSGRRLQQVRDASGSGRYINVFWGADGRLSSLQDVAGRQIGYTYDGAHGTLSTVTDPLNRQTTYSYTQGKYTSLLTQVSDNWGRVVATARYDQQDRVTSYLEDGETYSYTYDYQNNGLQTAKFDSSGNTWVYLYGTAGLVVDEIPPAGSGVGTHHTDYNADGSIQQVIDALGIKTCFSYDALGNVLAVTQDCQGPGAIRFEYAYDPRLAGRVTSVTPKNPGTGAVDPTWQAWQYDYYEAGDPAPGALHHSYRVETDGITRDLVATYTYDHQGRILSWTDADGVATAYAYDANGNLATVTASPNNDSGVQPITNYTYDALGRVATFTDAMGSTTTYVRDAIGRPTSITLPPPSPASSPFAVTYAYDTYDPSSGLLFASASDPNGVLTREGLDAFGRTHERLDAQGALTQYAYAANLLTSVLDPNGNLTTYVYDSLKRLSATIFPDSARETYTYYGNGLLNSQTDRKAHTTTYTYDHMGRVASTTYADGSAMSYTYSGASLTSVVDSSTSPPETHSFLYDASYRRTSEVQGARGTVTYTFTPGDRRAGYQVANGQGATYAYYPNGSIKSIQWSPVAGLFTFTYNLAGQYVSVLFPNGQQRSYTYDGAARPLQISTSDPLGGTLAMYSYGYDVDNFTGAPGKLGLRSSMVASVPSQGLTAATTRYYYDSAYRLVRTDYPQGPPTNGEVDEWTYDEIGNRLTSAVNGVVSTYSYQRIGANTSNWQRLLSDGDNTYTYDANGNVLTRADALTSHTFTTDLANRVVSRTGNGGATVSVYDFRNRRVSLSRGGVVSTFLFADDVPVESTGAAPEAYLSSPERGELLATYQGGAVYFATVDDQGSVVALSDASGAVHFSAVYDSWGLTRTTAGELTSTFGFAGRPTDVSTFVLTDLRYYSPQLGRFLQEDPGPDMSAPSSQRLGEPEPWDGKLVTSPWSRAAYDAPAGAPGIRPTLPSYDYGESNPVLLADPDGRVVSPLICLPLIVVRFVYEWKCDQAHERCIGQCQGEKGECPCPYRYFPRTYNDWYCMEHCQKKCAPGFTTCRKKIVPVKVLYYICRGLTFGG